MKTKDIFTRTGHSPIFPTFLMIDIPMMSAEECRQKVFRASVDIEVEDLIFANFLKEGNNDNCEPRPFLFR